MAGKATVWFYGTTQRAGRSRVPRDADRRLDTRPAGNRGRAQLAPKRADGDADGDAGRRPNGEGAAAADHGTSLATTQMRRLALQAGVREEHSFGNAELATQRILLRGGRVNSLELRSAPHLLLPLVHGACVRCHGMPKLADMDA